MPSPNIDTIRSPETTASRVVTDRRLHKRVPVVLLGRFMRASKHEYPCKLIDVSVGGAALMSPAELEFGERVIAYFDQLGGLEGTVSRTFSGGFGMQFSMTAHKREKLAATLMFMLNKDEQPGIEARRHERIAFQSRSQSLTLIEGLTIACDVTDMSLSGASIVTAARPTLGTTVKLGNLSARVVRHHARGIALEFIDVQNPNALRRYFG
jgi:hypothetical protein